MPGRSIDALIVVAITAFAAAVSQRWPGFNSPDSEFYASLALHGSEVLDRTVEPSYFWTRLGYIAPVRLLVTAFGPWVGFEVWRILLLAVIVTSVYALIHVAGRPRALGALLALGVSLNTVVLSYVGNTYLTATIMAGTFAVIALGVSLLGSSAARGNGLWGTSRWVTGLLTGGILSWIAMTNPYGFVLAAAIWSALRIVAVLIVRTDRWRLLLIDLAAVAVGGAVGASAFLLAGRVMFPGRSWLGTYLEWNSRLDYTLFMSDETVWQRDTALFVVAVSVIVAILVVLAHPVRRWAWAALAVSVSNIAITVLVMVVFTGPWLESPTYIALLWPGALSAIALAFITLVAGTYEQTRLTSQTFVLTGVVLAPALIIAGRYEDVLGVPLGLAIAALIIAMLGAVIANTRRQPIPIRSLAAWLSTAIVVTFVGVQIEQNGRGVLGIYGQYPLAGAYGDYKNRAQMQAKIAVQDWLMERTTRTDTIAIWTDPAGLGASTAAMQFWGGDNLITLDAQLSDEATKRLETVRPSVMAMYSPTRDLITDFYDSLPPWALPSELECTVESFPVVPSGEMIACLTRLNWVG